MRYFVWWVLLFGWRLAAADLTSSSEPPQDLVVVDEDWNVPGDFICECNLPLLLHSPNVTVLALTAVTGDAWRDEGTDNVLEFLEEIHRPEIPVAKGAVFPLIDTPARLAAWEALYGPLSWKGAWNSPQRESTAHPSTPFAIRVAREGPPHHPASSESAVSLMIRLVHEHPHQITFIAGGPLTNFALAVRQDDQFAHLAKRLVLGDIPVRALVDGTKSPPPKPRFNLIFDPEAAHITLTAGWPEIVCLYLADKKEPMTDAALLARVQEHPTAATNFLAKNTGVGTPLWAVEYAVVADPSLIQSERTVPLRLDVNLDDHSPLFGSTILPSSDAYAGPAGGTPVTIITELDEARFVSAYVRALQAPDVGDREIRRAVWLPSRKCGDHRPPLH